MGLVFEFNCMTNGSICHAYVTPTAMKTLNAEACVSFCILSHITVREDNTS